jgi:acetyl esterase
MALSDEVKQSIADSIAQGFDKFNLRPPAETRELMKKAPPNPHPIPVGEVVNLVLPGARVPDPPGAENRNPPGTEMPILPGAEIPLRIYIPEGKGPFPVVVYFHGGGFVLMSIDTHDDICRQICVQSGSVVLSVGYLLAPEHPYPAGPDSCLAAAKWMTKNAARFRGDAGRMAVAGDSAGGYMALATAQGLTAEGYTLKAQFATYPVTDHYSAHHPSWVENGKDYVLTAEIMKWFWDNFLPDPTKAEEASPLRTKSFLNLPPALIFTCNYDPLRDEGRDYADKLQQAYVDTRYRNWENIHGFFGLGKMGQEAMDVACGFLKGKLRAND